MYRLRSWQFFLFVFRKVKYIVVRKLNRSQTRKTMREERGEGKGSEISQPSSSHPLPYRFRFLVWPLKQTKNTLNSRINPSESVSVWLNSGMPLKKIKISESSSLYKAFKRICHLQILIGVLYMQLIGMYSLCFILFLCLFVCVFAYLLQLIYFFFVCCVHLFIHNNLAI